MATYIQVICQNLECCKPFPATIGRLNQGEGKYCCHACSSYARTRPIADRLWEKVLICQHGIDCPFCCWPWMAKRHKAGYGLIGIKQDGVHKFSPASRIAWECHNGQKMPDRLWALHHCDNPPCCNFDHIYAGTPKNNTQDAIRRNRFPKIHTWEPARDMQLPHTKLTPAQVVLARKRYEYGDRQCDIAQDLQVSRASISLIVHRKNRKHID